MVIIDETQKFSQLPDVCVSREVLNGRHLLKEWLQASNANSVAQAIQGRGAEHTFVRLDFEAMVLEAGEQ